MNLLVILQNVSICPLNFLLVQAYSTLLANLPSESKTRCQSLFFFFFCRRHFSEQETLPRRNRRNLGFASSLSGEGRRHALGVGESVPPYRPRRRASRHRVCPRRPQPRYRKFVVSSRFALDAVVLV